jgi:hypothetical protein
MPQPNPVHFIDSFGELWAVAGDRIDLSLNYSTHRRHTE